MENLAQTEQPHTENTTPTGEDEPLELDETGEVAIEEEKLGGATEEEHIPQWDDSEENMGNPRPKQEPSPNQ